MSLAFLRPVRCRSRGPCHAAQRQPSRFRASTKHARQNECRQSIRPARLRLIPRSTIHAERKARRQQSAKVFAANQISRKRPIVRLDPPMAVRPSHLIAPAARSNEKSDCATEVNVTAMKCQLTALENRRRFLFAVNCCPANRFPFAATTNEIASTGKPSACGQAQAHDTLGL